MQTPQNVMVPVKQLRQDCAGDARRAIGNEAPFLAVKRTRETGAMPNKHTTTQFCTWIRVANHGQKALSIDFHSLISEPPRVWDAVDGAN
jgi:hypothetical protein